MGFKKQNEDSFSWLDGIYEHEPVVPPSAVSIGRASSSLPWWREITKHWLLWIMLVIAGGLGYGFYQFLSLGDFSQTLSDSHERYAYRIGSHRFSIPQNYLRRVDGAEAEQTDRLELHALWPNFEGFSSDQVMAFSATTEETPVIRLSVDARAPGVTGRTRLEKIYSLFFEGKLESGPEGLVYRYTKAGSPYKNEIIYYQLRYDEKDNNPFVARCPREVPGGGVSICTRSLTLHSGIHITYRFPAGLLSSWRVMDERVKDLLDRFTYS